MTLKELKQAVGSPRGNGHYKRLKKGENIFLRVQTESGAIITVFKSGHVIYQIGNRLTCFSIAACGDYTYTFSDGSTSVIQAEEFDQYDWMIRVILEGESRIAQNLVDEYFAHCLGVKSGDTAETVEALSLLKEEIFIDPSPTAEEQAIAESDLKQLKKALEALVPRQKEFVYKHYVQGKNYEEIAKE